ncbi:MAG: leucine-rich repeat domain-containing protein [Clostridia bacterium]
MCKSKKKRLQENREDLKSCELKFDVLATIVQDNAALTSEMRKLQQLVKQTNPSEEKNIVKLDKKIIKRVDKLRTVSEKESKKGKYKKSTKLAKALEIAIVERGCFNRMQNVCDEKDFVIQDGTLTKYKGKDAQVVIPNNVKVIGEKAFYQCETINELFLNDATTTIMANAFEMCKALSSVVLSSNLNSIGDSAFYNCQSLTNVVLEDGLAKIGHYAFAKCATLQAIKLPKSLVSIGDNAFLFDKNLSRKSKRKIKKLNKKAL